MNTHIEIKNARIHNLRGIDVSIPKQKLTVITGVSGSGKSSLAFDTLYEEGKRRYLMFSGTEFMVDSVLSFDSITGLSFYDSEQLRHLLDELVDMLKIGQLFLHEGMHRGERILYAEYIRQAVTPLKSNPAYGFLWWVGDDWYGCRGYGGQSVTVIPAENAVIVTQATPTDRGMGYFDLVGYCREVLQGADTAGGYWSIEIIK